MAMYKCVQCVTLIFTGVLCMYQRTVGEACNQCLVGTTVRSQRDGSTTPHALHDNPLKERDNVSDGAVKWPLKWPMKIMLKAKSKMKGLFGKKVQSYTNLEEFGFPGRR